MKLVQELLLESIKGEQEAQIRYAACTRKALEESYPDIAKLFMALSRAERIHATNHIEALKKSGFADATPQAPADCSIFSTQENLEKAVKNEFEEFKIMYPGFRKQIARKYGKNFIAQIALLSMRWASDAEKKHYDLLREALNLLISKKIHMNSGDYYLCTVCGNIHYSEQEPDQLCPVCGHDISFYSLIQV